MPGVGSSYDLGVFGAWLAMFADIRVRGANFVWRLAGGRWKTVRVRADAAETISNSSFRAEAPRSVGLPDSAGGSVHGGQPTAAGAIGVDTHQKAQVENLSGK